jgi:hypothetical protein
VVGVSHSGFKLGFNYLKAKRFVEAIDIAHQVTHESPTRARRRLRGSGGSSSRDLLPLAAGHTAWLAMPCHRHASPDRSSVRPSVLSVSPPCCVRPQVLAKFPDYPKIKKEILDKARQGLRS